MKCITCENFSLFIICKSCQKRLLNPSLYKKEIDDGFYNYSFYSFSDIEELLNSKYYFYGDKIFNILAKLSFKKFAENFFYDENIYSIAIDEHTRHHFSQTAILSKHLNSKCIKPLYGKCSSKNIVKYAGKDLEFRKKNKRDFQVSISNKKIILVDDLITTGTTILEAKKTCEKKQNEVLFSLTLCDASIKN